MRFERGYQIQILKKLAETAPTYAAAMDWLEEIYRADSDKYAANMLYLHNEGLVISNVQVSPDGRVSVNFPPQITAAGVNFLLDEETITFHTEEIRQTLYTVIERSDLTAEGKNRYRDAIKNAHPEVLKASLHTAMECLLNNAVAIGVWGGILIEGDASS